ncbi:Shedu anti-phage system protein SduA domain-containing protein [Bacillus inaquosorum]|nr:Shedu anti-phage system protein SduA domain-containing protein [Bacillus inaquosorum]
MSIFLKSYNLVSDSPEPLKWEDYEKKVLDDYRILLQQQSENEKVFQDFFEKNPAMLPGAYGFFGESGHAPYNNVLITQPVLQGLITKVPDFLWIASDSLNIYPIFIEIEAPSKKWFNQ